jgi:hypothetical protein
MTGWKIIGFMEKAYDFARQNPNLALPYLGKGGVLRWKDG